MKKYYIGYGLTLNSLTMATNCPNCKLIRTDFLEDHKLAFKCDSSGYLTIEESIENKIPVSIYSVLEENIKYLDRFIGYPSLYRKKIILIKNKQYFTYEIKPNFNYCLPDSCYFQQCLNNYYYFGFSSKVLHMAKEEARQFIKK